MKAPHRAATRSKNGSKKGSARKLPPTKPLKKLAREPDVVIQTNEHRDTIVMMVGGLKLPFPGGKGKRLYVWARKTFEAHTGRLPREVVDRRPNAPAPTMPFAWEAGFRPGVGTLPTPTVHTSTTETVRPAPPAEWLGEVSPPVRRVVEYVKVLASKLGHAQRDELRAVLLEHLKKGML